MNDLPAWQREFKDLLDTDPEEAVRRARALSRYSGPAKAEIEDFRAAILVDGGAAARDPEAIREGVAVLQSLIEQEPSANRHYNLANGFAAVVDSVEFTDANWWLTTADDRRSARAGYRRALGMPDPLLWARCWTNLGNQLIRSHRWVEAYDAYQQALALDPTHGIALTGAAKVLLRAARQGLGDPLALKEAAARHLELARAHPERIREQAGLRAERELAKLLQLSLDVAPRPRTASRDPYVRFVSERRLALSLTIEGLESDLARWDSLVLPGIVEPLSAGAEAPPVFAAFNALKSEYLAARYLVFLAVRDQLPESGNYADTLDYANYGVSQAGLIVAQRAAVDLLDKIAVAACEYFGVDLPVRGVYFRKFWRLRSGKKLGHWRDELAREVMLGNTGLVALTDLAEDLDDEGALVEHRLFRDAATHRFVILHDLGGRPGRNSRFATHVDQRAFERTVVESLRITRAALLYFVDMLRQHSGRMAKSLDRVGNLHLRDHDWVRGREAPESPRRKGRRPPRETHGK